MKWSRELQNTGNIESRGSGNYASVESKEIARLYVSCVIPRTHWVFKKCHQHSGKITETIYVEVAKKVEAAHHKKRCFSSPECCKNWVYHEPGIDRGSTENHRIPKNENGYYCDSRVGVQ